MAILAECPKCRNRLSVKNKVCKCGENLVKAKRSKRVRYWIQYRLPDGKQRKEFIGSSITDAQAADGEKKSKKKRKQFFEMLPESKMTFKELSEWYLDLPKVKTLKDYNGVKIRLNNFNNILGDKIVSTLKPIDLENYQAKRKNQNIKNTTIDLELLGTVKGMIVKGFDNDMVSGKTLKTFRKIKKISTKSERSRKRTLTIEEYLNLIDKAAQHLRDILIVAFNTGMRPGELKGLKWSYIDRKANFIRLPARVTKEKASKTIPINSHVKTVLDNVPRAINHDYVFTYKGNQMGRRGSSYAFQTACRKAQIPCGQKVKNGITMQDFRRSFKTNMLKAGVDKIYRDKIVGHSLHGMDTHYIVPSDLDLQKAIEKFTEWFDNEVASVTQVLPKNQKSA